MVTKAVVLAAGFGTRLRPLTCRVPKPLLPVWGEPMLARVVSRLRELGVTDITVNASYQADQIAAWCGANGCRVSREPEILGTGGALNPLREWIGKDPFYLVNGDIVIENVPALELPESDEVIGCALVTEQGPQTIEVEPSYGYVTCWQSPEPGWPGTKTYCGWACLKAEILDYVKPEGASSIVEAYEKAMMDGHFIQVEEPADLMWTDAGTIPSYIFVNEAGEDNAFADIPPIREALQAIGDDPAKTTVRFLGARGSDRCFFSTGKDVIVIYDDAKRGENARYATLARELKAAGLPVPEVRADLPEWKTTVFEHVGGVDLRERVRKAGPRTIESYVPVVELLVSFHQMDASKLVLEPSFDQKLYAWEQDLFAEYCLGRIFLRPLADEVKAELAQVSERLLKEPLVPIHRDFQSTNVLWRDEKPAIIDFQGMRYGAAAYDLASLLYDPYVELTAEDRHALAALYARKANRPDIEAVLPMAAVQRLVQALGAYGRLISVGQTDFAHFILPALSNLLAAADDAGLDALGALAEELIAEEMKRVKKQGHACSRGHDEGPLDDPHHCACGHDHDSAGEGHTCSCGHHHGEHDHHCTCGHDHCSHDHQH